MTKETIKEAVKESINEIVKENKPSKTKIALVVIGWVVMCATVAVYTHNN